MIRNKSLSKQLYSIKGVWWNAVMWGWVAIALMGCSSNILVKAGMADHYELLFDPVEFGANSIVWSHSTNEMAITSLDINIGPRLITILDVDTKDSRIVMDTDGFIGSAEAWSPDGQHLLIYRDIYYVGKDGTYVSGQIRLFDRERPKVSTFLTQGRQASWSSSGDIAIIRKQGYSDDMRIFLYDIEIGSEELIFQKQGLLFTGFSWSPNGNRIVFSLAENLEFLLETDHADLYVLDVDTKEIVKLTTDLRNLYPSWSPTRNLIAYQKSTDIPNSYSRGSVLHIMNIDLNCDISVTPTDFRIWNPIWSPDGKQIAFIHDGRVYRLDLVGEFGEAFYEDEFPCNISDVGLSE